jgi:hypothetical protein
LYLAVHNGSLVASLGGTEKLKQTYLCLYGNVGAGSSIGAPTIPDAVVYVGLLQAIFSGVLVFLFLLAVRNHFRIK